MVEKKQFYVTTPIYYATSKAHIGHAYTTIVADVLARYHRFFLSDDSVFFLTGTDEHGSKIYEKASSENIEVKDFVDKISAEYKDLWSKLNISYNKFIRTTDKEHEDFVKNLVNELKEKKYLYSGDYEALYCVACESFLQEKDLVNGLCPDHLKEPVLLKEKNWFFDLNGKYTGRNFLKELEILIEKDILKIEPTAMKKEVLALLKQDLPNFSISRSKEKVKWGIPLPWDSEQVIYVWADALTNYISAVNGEQWWPAQVQLLGKDILKFHAIYWPAILLALGYELPERIFAHGFFTVNGQKMSKTIGNVLDPYEIVEEYSSDFLRYILITSIAFGQDGNIEKELFIEKYNGFFANNLGNLLNRLLVLLNKHYESVLLSRNENLEFDTADLVKKMWGDYHKSINELRVDNAFKIIEKLLDYSNEYISNLELWNLVKEDKELASYHFYILFELLRHIILMLNPFLPETAERIADLLNINIKEESVDWGGFKINHKVKKAEVLFPRLK